MNPGMNNGFTPASKDVPVPASGPATSQGAGSSSNASWKSTSHVDFQGNNLTVTPMESPFWGSLGSALSGLGQTLSLTLGSLWAGKPKR